MSASAPPSNVQSQEFAAKRARGNGTPDAAREAGRSIHSPENKSSPNSASGSNHNMCVLVPVPAVHVATPANTSNDRHRSGGAPPMVKVKRELGSPGLPSSRPRPKRLDLSSSMSSSHGGPHTGRPSAPLTSRESAGLAIQDVGLACLSPGFATSNPGMREQLQRSLDVRDQQRMIIEARQKGTKPGSSLEHDGPRTQDTTLFGVQTGARTPMTSRRKGPPTALSINAPSAAQFQHDRVIQSAPLHQTFTGLRPGEYPHSRHAQHGPSGLSQTSHIHHVPATQTNNRLPPIADVFANDRLDSRRYPNTQSNSSPGHSSHSNNAPPPVPSPGFHTSQSQAPSTSARTREFRSAEEAVQGLSGGREELLPKVVHYGGVQPPTPPSPVPSARHHHHHTHSVSAVPGAQHPGVQHLQETSRPDILARTASMNGRRRGREEYEREGISPPLAYGRPESKRASFAVRGEEHEQERDWRSGMGSTEKKEEFLRHCERAWDLFHS